MKGTFFNRGGWLIIKTRLLRGQQGHSSAKKKKRWFFLFSGAVFSHKNSRCNAIVITPRKKEPIIPFTSLLCRFIISVLLIYPTVLLYEVQNNHIIIIYNNYYIIKKIIIIIIIIRRKNNTVRMMYKNNIKILFSSRVWSTKYINNILFKAGS